MTFLSNNDLQRLGAQLAVANTGNYIFRRFSDDPIVKSLAMRPSAELLAKVRDVDSTDAPSFNDEVEGYAATVALLLSGEVSLLEKHDRAGKRGLKWLGELVANARSQHKAPVGMVTVKDNDYNFNLSNATIVTSSGAPVGSASSPPRPQAPSLNKLIIIG